MVGVVPAGPPLCVYRKLVVLRWKDNVISDWNVEVFEVSALLADCYLIRVIEQCEVLPNEIYSSEVTVRNLVGNIGSVRIVDWKDDMIWFQDCIRNA